jgi:protein-S-isoprenylcysteine O-methyltransferase Ste14
MKATSFEFRFRLWIAAILYILGFWAPWSWFPAHYGTGAPQTTAWLALSTSLARLHWLPLDQATILITVLAIVCTAAAAGLRVWGTSCLGSSIVHSGAMHAGSVMAAGPYRFVRNPLYLGSMLFALGVSILMPPSGAIFFVIAMAVFYFRLILAEEDYLEDQVGAPYQEYRRRVPRLLPGLRPRLPAPAATSHWLEAVLAETLPLSFAGCLAILAWRYEPEVLIRCLLVCFGISLVARALLPRNQPAHE